MKRLISIALLIMFSACAKPDANMQHLGDTADKETISSGSTVTWGNEKDKLNRMFTELYGKVVSAVSLNSSTKVLTITFVDTTTKTVDLTPITGGAGVSSYADIIALFGGGSCSGYLKSDGSCETPAGISHNPVTIGTANGLLLANQQLSLSPSTTTTPGAMTAAQATKLAAIEAGAQVNVQPDWNASSGGAQILNKPAIGTIASHAATEYQVDLSVPTQAEAEAGTSTAERVWTAQRIAQAIAALGTGGSSTIVKQADCSTITNGFCIDTDDGSLYYHDGIDVVTLYMPGVDSGYGLGLHNNTSGYTPPLGYTVGFDFVGNYPYAYFSGANHRLQTWDANLDTWATITPGTGFSTAAGTATNAAAGFPTIKAKGTSALGTSAIASGSCASVVSTAAANVATTSSIVVNPNARMSQISGYGYATTGALRIDVYPTAGYVNFEVCNQTAASITPGALTLNWMAF